MSADLYKFLHFAKFFSFHNLSSVGFCPTNDNTPRETAPLIFSTPIHKMTNCPFCCLLIVAPCQSEDDGVHACAVFRHVLKLCRPHMGHICTRLPSPDRDRRVWLFVRVRNAMLPRWRLPPAPDTALRNASSSIFRQCCIGEKCRKNLPFVLRAGAGVLRLQEKFVQSLERDKSRNVRL